MQYQKIKREYNLKINRPQGKYHCIILAVAHKEFNKMKMEEILSLAKEDCYIIDVKGAWNRKISSKFKDYWCL